MKDADLVRMANQITTFFEVYPKSEALDYPATRVELEMVEADGSLQP